MDINIDSQLVVKTAVAWAADATVYSAKRILITSDAFYGATDQRKFKIADGVQTWSNLDYFPVSGYDDATSSIQTQLNNRLRIINKSTADSSILTGSTSNTILYSYEIPANTFTVGDVPEFSLRNVFTGLNGTKTTRVYLNTANTLTSAMQLCSNPATAAQQSTDLARRIAIKSSTVTQAYNATTSGVTAELSPTNAVTEHNIDWTQPVWIIVACQLANGADSAVNSFFKLTS